MADINSLLKVIKTGKKAIDVKNAIHDSIKQCYTDAAQKGNSSMEIVQARGSYNSINERISKIEEV